MTADDAVLAVSDGSAQDVFFWHDDRFVGIASPHITYEVWSMRRARRGSIAVTYVIKERAMTPRPTLRFVRVVYQSNGQRLTANRRTPAKPGKLEEWA